MLKIKNDIDLKELEKFGFKKFEYINGLVYKFTRFNGKNEIRNLIISSNDRILHYNVISVRNDLDIIVFDLIQAGFVEKVD